MGTRVWSSAALTKSSGNQNFAGDQSGLPVGPAGGDLDLTYPNPNVVALHSGASRLAVGALTDGLPIVRSGLTLASSPLGVAGSAGNVYLTPPAVADAMDDEFKTGSSDFAARGWTVTNTVTGAVMTRVGDVTQAAPALSATTYRSTLTASGMLVQATSQMTVYKAWTFGSSGALYCHMSQLIMPSASTFFEAPQLWMPLNLGDPPQQSNGNRKLFINNYPVPGNNRVFSRMDLNQAYTTLATYNYAGTDSFPWGGWLSWDNAGKLAAGAVFNPYGERALLDSSGNSWPAFAPFWAGFSLVTANAANTWVTVRCFRKLPLGKWPGIV